MIKPKILIVDDDPNLIRLYEAGLESRGYRVITACNGEEALDAFEKNYPDLVIMDVMMPQLNGLHALQIIKATPETKDTKIMMLTALSDEALKKRAKRLGASEYVVKTEATIGDILARVDNLLG